MLNQNHNSQCIRLLKVNTLDIEATSGGLVSNSIYQYLKEVNTSPLNIALHIFKVLWNKSDESNLKVIWLESSKFSFNILTIGISPCNILLSTIRSRSIRNSLNFEFSFA